MQQATTHKPRRLIPVPEWPQEHSWPPPGGLRHLIFNSRTNGFDKCIRRVGRRVLICETSFFAWVDEQNNIPSPPKEDTR